MPTILSRKANVQSKAYLPRTKQAVSAVAVSYGVGFSWGKQGSKKLKIRTK